MTDDQQRAREQFEAWAAGVSYRGSNIDTTRNDLVPDWYIDPLAALAWRCWKAALRAAPEEVALRVAMETLEQIANAQGDQGARFKAAGAVAFLITQGAGGPEGFVMVPVELTLGMLEAGEQELAMGNDFADAWEAAIETMLVARPQGVKDGR